MKLSCALLLLSTSPATAQFIKSGTCSFYFMPESSQASSSALALVDIISSLLEIAQSECVVEESGMWPGMRPILLQTHSYLHRET